MVDLNIDFPGLGLNAALTYCLPVLRCVLSFWDKKWRPIPTIRSLRRPTDWDPQIAMVVFEVDFHLPKSSAGSHQHEIF